MLPRAGTVIAAPRGRRTFQYMLAALGLGDRNRVVAVEAGPAQAVAGSVVASIRAAREMNPSESAPMDSRICSTARLPAISSARVAKSIP